MKRRGFACALIAMCLGRRFVTEQKTVTVNVWDNATKTFKQRTRTLESWTHDQKQREAMFEEFMSRHPELRSTT